jgi:hypothetical protein
MINELKKRSRYWLQGDNPIVPRFSNSFGPGAVTELPDE